MLTELFRFLHHTVSTRVFSPALIPPLLQQMRCLIFPNNSLGPPPPQAPSPEEARRLRSKAARDILSLIPTVIARRIFGVEASYAENEDRLLRLEVEERILAWTDDRELNKYLIYATLEHIILRLVPEMVNNSPSELLAERGVDLIAGSESDLDENAPNGTEP
jgi:hypothetical protein